MADEFINQTLAISVAQICDNIGWHSITDSSMKIMRDMLHHYIVDLSVQIKKYSEHNNCLVPGINDVEKAFLQKRISLAELRRYIKQTGSVKFPHSLPPLNISGKSTFNIMKPGSREIVTRPIHFHEHLPTLYSEQIEEEQIVNKKEKQQEVKIIKHEQSDEEIMHKRLREISSVVMTSGGFLSPSREGKLAESKLLPLCSIKTENFEKNSTLSAITETKSELLPKKLISKKKLNKTKKIKSKSNKKHSLSNNSNSPVKKKNKKKLNVFIKNKKLKEDPIEVPVLKDIKEPQSIAVNEELVKSPIRVESPIKEVSKLQTSSIKLEDVLPKFSFFGSLPQGPGLIPSTFPLKLKIPEVQPIIPEIETEIINKKELKKKKKEKKKERKEKKKKKEKSSQKVPKIKLKLGMPIETVKENDSIINPVVENISTKPKIEQIKVDDNVTNIEQKSDVFVDILNDVITPPKIPSQKIKVKIATKLTQSITTKSEKQPPPAFYYDEAGNQVWICPMCTKQDDGSPMIGCDGCDVWYHWVCVGIQCPPDCAVWYCPVCLAKRAQQPSKGKRGRPRKNK
ncbi:transcription initiation factor TFIID subunit 3-like [Daktulosphaira vitifoliae]|uniref:transcription initiation factor TFIID subunit 3-like n=1 Tax=Daktulosphaira vitifoliae TaxID=58002 RepID=UPI0021AA6373|nr:transcription initiation factor TFIID subunit 3-like [Daktulosphaira vitifoliae]